MGLLDYDFADLAHQVQHGLERISVNYLRDHGARVRRDLVNFHGYEQIHLELSHGGHTLVVWQAGRPKSPGMAASELPPPTFDEVFDSRFDGVPSHEHSQQEIAHWLASLPAGVVPIEEQPQTDGETNPFAAERRTQAMGPRSDSTPNPFRQARRLDDTAANPFLDPEREKKRADMLRRLRGD